MAEGAAVKKRSGARRKVCSEKHANVPTEARIPRKDGQAWFVGSIKTGDLTFFCSGKKNRRRTYWELLDLENLTDKENTSSDNVNCQPVPKKKRPRTKIPTISYTQEDDEVDAGDQGTPSPKHKFVAPEEEETFSVGDYCWVKHGVEHPWWPAIYQGRTSGGWHEAIFCNSNTDGIVKDNQIRPFARFKDCFGMRLKKNQMFMSALRRATKLYMQQKSVSSYEVAADEVFGLNKKQREVFMQFAESPASTLAS